MQKKNSTDADQFVLYGAYGNEYFEGKIYNHYWSSPIETVVIRRVNSKYEIVPGGYFWSANACGDRLIIGYKYDTLTEARSWGMIYHDSSGCFYTPAPKYIPAHDAVFRGSGKSARLLLFGTVDRDYANEKGEEVPMGVCSLVDLDSGTVILDSIYIPALMGVSWYEGVTYPTSNDGHLIFLHKPSGLYGMMDANGNIVLPPKYTAIQATDNPKVYTVNGKKKVKIP